MDEREGTKAAVLTGGENATAAVIGYACRAIIYEVYFRSGIRTVLKLSE